MSVSPDDPRRLPEEFRPLSLGGTSKFPLFSIATDQLPAILRAVPDGLKPDRHWFVEPSNAMAAEDFQQSLCGTRALWRYE